MFSFSNISVFILSIYLTTGTIGFHCYLWSDNIFLAINFMASDFIILSDLNLICVGFLGVCFERGYASRLLQIGHKSEKRQWHHNFWTWRHHQVFWWCFASLVKFSYYSKFHFNIITSSGLWQFFFINDWPEIQNRKYHHLSFAQYLQTGTR